MKQNYYYINHSLSNNEKSLYCGTIDDEVYETIGFGHIFVRNIDEHALMEFKPFNGKPMNIPFAFKYPSDVDRIMINLLKAETEKVCFHLLNTGNNDKEIHYVIIRNWIYPIEVERNLVYDYNGYINGNCFIKSNFNNNIIERGRYPQSTVFDSMQQAVYRLMDTISKP